MSVFVQDSLQRNGIGQRENNQIFIAAAMKKSGEVRRLAVSHRTERSHGLNVRKGEDDYRRRRHGLRASQKRVGLTELFEAGNEFCDLLGLATTIDIEVSRASLKPPALEERRQIILGTTMARGQDQRQDQKTK